MNNEHVKVRGFCDHNNFAAVGMATSPRINLFRAEASRSIGGNGRRTSHNPPDPNMLDIYDRVGMVVMAENREFGPDEEYYLNMADLVQRDRNHPSVAIWSYCNEGACGTVLFCSSRGWFPECIVFLRRDEAYPREHEWRLELEPPVLGCPRLLA